MKLLIQRHKKHAMKLSWRCHLSFRKAIEKKMLDLSWALKSKFTRFVDRVGRPIFQRAGTPLERRMWKDRSMQEQWDWPLCLDSMVFLEDRTGMTLERVVEVGCKRLQHCLATITLSDQESCRGKLRYVLNWKEISYCPKLSSYTLSEQTSHYKMKMKNCQKWRN